MHTENSYKNVAMYRIFAMQAILHWMKNEILNLVTFAALCHKNIGGSRPWWLIYFFKNLESIYNIFLFCSVSKIFIAICITLLWWILAFQYSDIWENEFWSLYKEVFSLSTMTACAQWNTEVTCLHKHSEKKKQIVFLVSF